MSQGTLKTNAVAVIAGKTHEMLASIDKVRGIGYTGAEENHVPYTKPLVSVHF